jgi:protein involved in polysaccharide export with SLBB domain
MFQGIQAFTPCPGERSTIVYWFDSANRDTPFGGFFQAVKNMVRLLSATVVAAALLGMAPLVGLDSARGQTAEPANSLLPGDLIRVQIWREESVSGDFPVDEKGVVTLSLLGTKEVAGISPDSLRSQLIAEYARFLVNPAVNITLLRRINVGGEVHVPGLYLVDATNSVADVIAKAQGVTPNGNAEDILLVRDGQTYRISGAVSLQGAGIRSGDQIIVGKTSWWGRNFGSVVNVMTLVATIAGIVTR